MAEVTVDFRPSPSGSSPISAAGARAAGQQLRDISRCEFAMRTYEFRPRPVFKHVLSRS